MRSRLITALALALGTYEAHALAAEPIVGGARIVDGDTIVIAGKRIRLEGIDAPERDQNCQDALGHAYDCGAAAVRVLNQLTKGQTLSCEDVGHDKYSRVLGICHLPNALDVNAELVRQGVAVAFRRYSTRYVTIEDEARTQRRGLWSGRFEPPGCFRAAKRGDECKDALPGR